MSQREEVFFQELLETFQGEATEHLQIVTNGLLELEKGVTGENRHNIVEAVFRSAHSLKGAARAVNLKEIEELCQSLENILAAMREGTCWPVIHQFDTLQRAINLLERLLTESATIDYQEIVAMKNDLFQLFREGGSSQDVYAATNQGVVDDVQHKPDHKISSIKDTVVPESSTMSGQKTGMGTIRIATSKLDLVFRQAEEMLVVKLNGRQRIDELREILAEITAWDEQFIRTFQTSQYQPYTCNRDGSSLGENSDVLAWFCNHNPLLKERLYALHRKLRDDQRLFSRMVDEHLHDMKKSLMLPFSSLLGVLPKMVRDLSRDYRKEVDLQISGSEIEMDRRILEAMKDPLIHLLRNSIDHGVEEEGERQRLAKPTQSILTVAVSQQEGNKICIVVTDDGRGINKKKVMQSARKLGRIPRDELENLDEHGVLDLSFQAGVTTSPIVTNISGRGVGLAIVKENVDKLGGKVSLVSEPGAGTACTIILPAIMASFRSVFVRVAERLFAIPARHVVKVLRIRRDSIHTIESRECVVVDDQNISLVWLSQLLGLTDLPQNKMSKTLSILNLHAGNISMAFVVDEILWEDEGLVKGFGKQLTRVQNFLGVTILGTGELAPILNVADLMNLACMPSGQIAHNDNEKIEDGIKKVQSVLVVEDSVTSRILLKNILDAADFHVVTAVDGVDGWTTLKAGDFCAVVADIEMPRMNGFDLTAKIRAHEKFSDLPIVLVTSLDSREDRERGIDVGANAYIVKSAFDQSNLLEVLQRLV